MSSASVAIHKNSAFKVPLPKKSKVSDCNKLSAGRETGRISTEGNNTLKLLSDRIKEKLNIKNFLYNSPLPNENLQGLRFYVNMDWNTNNPLKTGKLQVYYSQAIQVIVDRVPSQFSEEVHKSSASDTDVSDHTAESAQPEPKIGFYTKKERMERIRKFKAKKQRAQLAQTQKKVRYAKKSQVAKNRLRVNGKFVKA